MKPDQWWTQSWNPATGCTPVSEGCEHCYAARNIRRFGHRPGHINDKDPHHVVLHYDRFNLPYDWKRPRIVFPSMCDLFHEDVSDKDLVHLFGVMRGTPKHTYVLLTKRAERMAEIMQSIGRTLGDLDLGAVWPLPNVWPGVTVENQDMLPRVQHLLRTPAVVRVVSVEPMLGPVRMREPDFSDRGHGPGWLRAGNAAGGPQLGWVICGAETGPGARPMYAQWAVDLAGQCAAAGVPFWMKKLTGGTTVPPDVMRRERPCEGSFSRA